MAFIFTLSCSFCLVIVSWSVVDVWGPLQKAGTAIHLTINVLCDQEISKLNITHNEWNKMRRLRKKNGFLSLSLGVFSVFYVIISFLFLFLFFPMILKLQYFPVVLFFMLYKTVLTFESVDEILKCDHSSESYQAVLSYGTVYYAVQDGSYFWVCGWNPRVLPFKWKLPSCTFLWYCLLCCIRWFLLLSLWMKS